MNIGILSSHPIQYYSPIYRALSGYPGINLKVYYCHNQSASDQAKSGFNTNFDWDIPLLDGYNYEFLKNQSKKPNVNTFFGCDTPEISEIIKKSNFDAFIVHGWYLKSFWQAIIASWKTRTPILIRGDSQLNTERSYLKRVVKYPVYRWFMSRFDAYLNVGLRSREYYIFYGANKNKFFFSPHSVDNNFFKNNSVQYKKEKNRIRVELNIPEDCFLFLFSGKFNNKKRPLDFVKAVDKAQRNNINIWGLMVGDGDLMEDVKNEIRSKNSNIKLLGFLNQSEIVKAYSISDCLILPSDGGETWGLVVNEAMACGLPAVVSNMAGCSPDLIIVGKTGEVYNMGDIEELVSIINKLSEGEKLKEMGGNAEKHIENYSIDKSVKGIVDAIEHLNKA